MSNKFEEIKKDLRNLTPEDHDDLRQAYYETVEGLYALLEALKGQEAESLKDELKLAKQAAKALTDSKLGRVI
tara:strand:- start:149 stop:367 length:219 start_codon:yes stop_codon:yes gene_type:complete